MREQVVVQSRAEAADVISVGLCITPSYETIVPVVLGSLTYNICKVVFASIYIFIQANLCRGGF